MMDADRTSPLCCRWPKPCAVLHTPKPTAAPRPTCHFLTFSPTLLTPEPRRPPPLPLPQSHHRTAPTPAPTPHPHPPPHQVDDAEEEELWTLTVAAQFRHIQKHFGVDLPHSVLAHMDPILFKKIDWETTNGLEVRHREEGGGRGVGVGWAGR